MIVDEKKDLYEVGEIPPLGYVPKYMYAWTLRDERLGEPINAYQKEVVEIPQLRENEVLVLNYTCGINYNGVWAALGHPKNVVKSQGVYDKNPVDFFICGSESCGVVYAVGERVSSVNIGDKVICTGVQYDVNCEIYKETQDPRVSPSFRIWGYEGNWGAFAQFSKVMDIQCVKKSEALSDLTAGSVMATGATIHNMLKGWKGNEIKPGDVVLIWGGSGGLGSNAIPIVKSYGGVPIAVVSNDERGRYCIELGAKGYINRSKYNHWGMLSQEYYNEETVGKWLMNVAGFRKELYRILGERKDPNIILEHPGSDTLPTSIFLCAKKGMVVICGATSGYVGSLDLRYLWLGVKRLQGSHAGLTSDIKEYMNMIETGKITPKTDIIYQFDDIAKVHQMLFDKSCPPGNIAIQIIK